MSVVLPSASLGASHPIHPIQTVKEALHRFVPKMQIFSRQTFERFKEKLLGESENLHFLRGELNFDDECQKKLASLLISSNPYGLEGHQLRSILKECSDEIRMDIIEKAFDQSDFKFEKMMHFLDLKAEGGELEEMAECLPKGFLYKNKTTQQEIGKTFRVVTRFFPNFLDNLLKAFSVIDSVKSPETLWDFSAVMNIYFKVFMIPHALFTVVGAVVSAPASLFLITGGIILLAVVGICIYLKYRPCPNKLPLSTNLTEEAQKGNLDPVVGRDHDIANLSAYLGKKEDGIHTNLFLVGPPGVGKTELVKGVAQQYQEKKIFSLSAPELASGYNSIGDKIRLLLLDIKDHNDEVILFIDELGEAIKKNSSVNIAGILKPLIGGNGVQVIVAATEEEYEKNVIPEDALCSRFMKMEIKPTNEAQTLAILRSRMEHKGKNILFEKGIEQRIYGRCKGAQLPRTAVNILDLAINLVSAYDFKRFKSDLLTELTAELEGKRMEYQQVLDQDDNREELVAQIQNLVERIECQKKEDQTVIQCALKTQKLIKAEREFMRNRNALIQEPSKKEEVLFIHRYALPWMRKEIEKNLKLLPSDFPMQVNQTIIEKASKLGLK